MTPDITVVIATRDRAPELCRTLGRLAALPEKPPVIVVDNGSRDGTAALVRRLYPGVTLVRLRRNRRAAARTLGARRAATRYVAFSGDDSWWEPGALSRARALLARCPAPCPARGCWASSAARSWPGGKRSWPPAATGGCWASAGKRNCSPSTWAARGWASVYAPETAAHAALLEEA